MISELEEQARRLEQQITVFEKLHGDELKRFEEQLAVYRQLQQDELQMLRGQLQQLKDEIAAMREQEAGRAADANLRPVELTVTRRDFLSGQIPPSSARSA